MVGMVLRGAIIIVDSGYFHSLFRVPVKHSVEFLTFGHDDPNGIGCCGIAGIFVVPITHGD